MRLLQVDAPGRVDLDCQRTVAEELGVQLSVASGNGALRFAQPDGSYPGKFHASLLQTSFSHPRRPIDAKRFPIRIRYSRPTLQQTLCGTRESGRNTACPGPSIGLRPAKPPRGRVP